MRSSFPQGSEWKEAVNLVKIWGKCLLPVKFRQEPTVTYYGQRTEVAGTEKENKIRETWMEVGSQRAWWKAL